MGNTGKTNNSLEPLFSDTASARVTDFQRSSLQRGHALVFREQRSRGNVLRATPKGRTAPSRGSEGGIAPGEHQQPAGRARARPGSASPGPPAPSPPRPHRRGRTPPPQAATSARRPDQRVPGNSGKSRPRATTVPTTHGPSTGRDEGNATSLNPLHRPVPTVPRERLGEPKLQTSRSAPGRPPLPRPALLPPPLQRQALTATSRTRVRDCGKFQTACRALQKEEGAGAEQRQRERRRYHDPRWYRQPPHLRGPPHRPGGEGRRRRGGEGGTAVRPRAQSGRHCRDCGEGWWAVPRPAPPGPARLRCRRPDGLLEFRVGVGDYALWRLFSPGKARRRSEGAAPSSRPASPFLNRQRREGALFSVECRTALHALHLAPPLIIGQAGSLSAVVGRGMRELRETVAAAKEQQRALRASTAAGPLGVAAVICVPSSHRFYMAPEHFGRFTGWISDKKALWEDTAAGWVVGCEAVVGRDAWTTCEQEADWLVRCMEQQLCS
ncbi:serine/arginine repetitive matrix protein 3-like [Onychostruthus taczanowskii]|uniref:serine/arginine repetitive matrix protein 3-like n=1 Tax=Onychostruthus taczanowskii TaxID=356909 RepID=UPI001B80CAFA|nr:serine/arginine repetitive matrix protein 3-like [Onychostruthus taczanowskii]